MAKGVPKPEYTGEFKQMVVETMRKEKLSQYQVSDRFLVSRHAVQQWERIYLEEGPEGLYIERRGRKSTGRPKKLKSEVEEDLIAEVQRLRAENELLYLKAFDSIDQFRQELIEYLDYYNNRRIKAKLKGLPPAVHRKQALDAA